MSKQNDETSTCAELAALPVQHPNAADIDVGDATHCVCVDADGGDPAVREFSAQTLSLPQLGSRLPVLVVIREAHLQLGKFLP